MPPVDVRMEIKNEINGGIQGSTDMPAVSKTIFIYDLRFAIYDILSESRFLRLMDYGI